MRRLVLILLPLTVLMAACQSGITMWGSCDPAGDPTGTDGQYSMVCQDGRWTPVMTVTEWVKIRQGENITIAPVPDEPAPTTTIPPTTTDDRPHEGAHSEHRTELPHRLRGDRPRA